MGKPMLAILICVIVFNYCGDCAQNRSTFQSRLRYCRWLCAVRDSQQKNTIQTCYILADHQNITVTKCVSRCLVKHEEDVSNNTECQCQAGKCHGKSASESSATNTSASDPTTSTVSTTVHASSTTDEFFSAQNSTTSTLSNSEPPSAQSPTSTVEPVTSRLTDYYKKQ